MKRKYIFNWEIKNISQMPFKDDIMFVIEMWNGDVYHTWEYEPERIYITFIPEPAPEIEDKETVLIPA